MYKYFWDTMYLRNGDKQRQFHYLRQVIKGGFYFLISHTSYTTIPTALNYASPHPPRTILSSYATYLHNQAASLI